MNPVWRRFPRRWLLIKGLAFTALTWLLFVPAYYIWSPPGFVCQPTCQPYGFPPPDWDWRQPFVTAILVQSFYLWAWFMWARTKIHTRLGTSRVVSMFLVGLLFQITIARTIWPIRLGREWHVFESWAVPRLGWHIPPMDVDILDAAIVVAALAVAWSAVEVAAIPDPVVNDDRLYLLTDKHGVILFASPASEAILNWPTGMLTGKPVTTIIPARLHTRHHAGFRHWQETGEGAIFGKVLRVPAICYDGTETVVCLSISPADGIGGRQAVATLIPGDKCPAVDLDLTEEGGVT